MLTGEYFVLDGALALALPCRLGQTLQVEPLAKELLHWQSFDDQGLLWFEAQFSLSLDLLTSSDQTTALRLQAILRYIQQENANLFTKGTHFTTHLSFPRRWGLGTSSTLIYTLAQWAAINPYQLLFGTMGGSGYDIACAAAPQAIYYFKSSARGFANGIAFRPNFREQLYFVYLNQKQDSRAGIAHYKKNFRGDQGLIKTISQLSQALTVAPDLPRFAEILLEHEQLLSRTLTLPRAQTLYFADYPGVIKSLGAWGGDFVLATSEQSREDTLQYFQQKGFETVLPYDMLVL